MRVVDGKRLRERENTKEARKGILNIKKYFMVNSYCHQIYNQNQLISILLIVLAYVRDLYDDKNPKRDLMYKVQSKTIHHPYLN